HRIERIAQRKSCTPGQLALAWLLAQGPDIIPIPGTKRKERLVENLGALEVALSKADIAEISAAIPPGSAAGTRYSGAERNSVFLEDDETPGPSFCPAPAWGGGWGRGFLPRVSAGVAPSLTLPRKRGRRKMALPRRDNRRVYLAARPYASCPCCHDSLDRLLDD